MMEYGVNVGVKPKFFNFSDRSFGMQSFTIDEMLCTLELYGRKLYTKISKPTPDDYDAFPSNELAS